MRATHAPSDLRRRNRNLVLRHIGANRDASRAAIAEITGLTPAAVWRIARELIDVGLVSEGAPIERKGRLGRRNVRLVLNESGAYVLGIALSAHARSVAIASTSGQIVAREQLRGTRLDDPVRVLDAIASRARGLIERSGIEPARLLGGGVAIAGYVDHETGTLIRSGTLGESWKNVPVARILSDRLGIALRLESRPHALMLAELWGGQGAGLQNVFLVNSSLGLGSSLFMNGQLVRAMTNPLGGFAHYVVPGRKRICRCGRRGCLEAIASGFSILEATRTLDSPGLPVAAGTGGDLGRRLVALCGLADAGDRRVKHAFREAGQQLGIAVAGVLSLINPEAVILAGIVGRQPDYLAGILDTLRELRGDGEPFPLRVSGVTSDDAAVWLGLDGFVYSRELDIERLRTA